MVQLNWFGHSDGGHGCDCVRNDSDRVGECFKLNGSELCRFACVRVQTMLCLLHRKYATSPRFSCNQLAVAVPATCPA